MLGRSISPRKWRALVLLVAGVALIVQQSELPSAACTATGGSQSKVSRTTDTLPLSEGTRRLLVGLAELAVQTALGGFVGVCSNAPMHVY